MGNRMIQRRAGHPVISRIQPESTIIPETARSGIHTFGVNHGFIATTKRDFYLTESDFRCGTIVGPTHRMSHIVTRNVISVIRASVIVIECRRIHIVDSLSVAGIQGISVDNEVVKDTNGIISISANYLAASLEAHGQSVIKRRICAIIVFPQPIPARRREQGVEIVSDRVNETKGYHFAVQRFISTTLIFRNVTQKDVGIMSHFAHRGPAVDVGQERCPLPGSTRPVIGMESQPILGVAKHETGLPELTTFTIDIKAVEVTVGQFTGIEYYGKVQIAGITKFHLFISIQTAANYGQLDSGNLIIR